MTGYRHPSAQIGPGTRHGHNTVIHQNVRIGENCGGVLNLVTGLFTRENLALLWLRGTEWMALPGLLVDGE